MAEISLHAYLDYLEDRLSRDAYSEVVAHCRHILETYPKHLETYKLLARALAAQDESQDALDLFQRVLSSDPNDFIAHIGMSDAYRETNALEQAIWHLERAFEQVPNNLDLQEEIKRLYEQRGERAPRKIHLTSGALARMYLKGKLYDQAIAEIRAGIAKDPERLDLQVLLADALWESHQEVNAGKVAAEILKRLPYSLDANRILAQLWMKYNRPVEARPFLEHVGEVDPVMRYRLEHNGQEPSSESFRLVMLDFRPEQVAAQSGAADWVSQIGAIEKQKGVTGPLESSRVTSITDIFVKPTAEPMSSAPTEDMPDWLKSAITGNEAPASAPAVPDQSMSLAGGEDEPDWLKEALGKPSGSAAPAPAQPTEAGEQAPDWLQDAVGGTPAQPAAVVPPTPTPAAPLGGEDAPDWLKDALSGPSTSAGPAATAMGASPSDTPDWLQEALTGGPATLPERSEPEPQIVSPAPSGAEIAPDDDVPEWLEDIRSEEKRSAPPTELPTTVEDRDVPSWLNDILRDKPGSSPVPAASAETDAPGVVSDDWLDSFLAGGPPITTPSGTPEAVAPPSAAQPPMPEPARSGTAGLETWDDTPVADWLSQGALEESPKAEVADEGGVPAWLSSAPKVEAAPEAPAAAAEDEELPAWLAGAVSAKSTEQAQPEPSSEAEEALPAWLNANVPSVPAVEIARPTSEPESDELPDWLMGSPEVQSGLGEKPAPQAEEESALPDWLSSAPKAEAAPAAPIVADDEGELPDWLAGAGKDEEEETALPDWFSSSAPETPTPAPAAAIVEDEGDEGGLPDWLSGGEKEEQAEGELDWLANLNVGTPAQPAPEAEAEEDLPSWMSQGEPKAEAEEGDWLAQLDAGQPAIQPLEPTASDFPDWMSEGETPLQDAAPAQASETDWMAEFEMSAPATAEPQRAESETPDWMSDEDEEPEAEEASVVASEPDWMSQFEEQAEPQAESEPEPAGISLPSWLDEEDEDEIEADEPPQATAPEAKPQPAQTDWLSTNLAPTRALPYMETLPGDDEFAPPPKELFIDNETPDWLKMMSGQDEAPAAQEHQDEPVEELGGQAESEPEIPALPASEEETQVVADDQPMGDEGADIPSWLTDGDLDSDDAVKWLEEIAAKYDPNYGKEGEATPAAESTPEPIAAEASSDDDEDLPSWLSDEPAAAPEPATAMQEESDEALPSWLRSDDEDEELPSWLKSDEEVTTPAATATPVALASDNGSDELAWLDEEVTAQGISPSGVVSQDLTPDHPPVAASPIPPPDATAEPVSDDDLPEWLRGEDIEVEMEKASTALSSEYGDLPDLDVEDEELAWLDSALKAEEGTTDVDVNFEELLGGGDDEEKLPSWLTDEEEEEKAPVAPAMASEPEPALAAVSDDEDLPDWLSDIEPEAPAEPESAVAMAQPEPEPEPPASEPEAVRMEAPAEEDTLPAWLSGAGESVDDTGLDDFLKVVVPAATKEPTEAPQAPAAPEPPKPAPLPVTGPLAPPPVAAAPSMPAPAAAAPSGAGLGDARTKMTDGFPADSLNIYEDLVASGQSLDDTIMDLNEYVKGRRVDPRAFRIMGDAMMGQGRLQDALDMYRKALDQY